MEKFIPDEYQSESRVLVRSEFGFLADEEGILQFYSERNALNFMEERNLPIDGVTFEVRPIIDGRFSIEH